LREVAKFDIHSYPDVDTLKNALYKIYAHSDKQQGFSNSISNEDYQNLLLDITPSSTAEIITIKTFLNFNKKNIAEEERINKIKMRISINAHPDRILYVIKDIIEKQQIFDLPYVYNVKVINNTKWAKKLYDPIIIYYYDTLEGTNTDVLGRLLLDLYAEDVRPSHPAMQGPINGEKTQGIAYADQSKGGSWGKTRINLIVEAIWELKERKEEIDLETLLPEVEKRFRADGINPKKPQWNLHKEDE
jgi:hypothetical protein